MIRRVLFRYHCEYKSLVGYAMVADNARNAGVVLGEFWSTWTELADVIGKVYGDHAGVLDQGRGRDVLGHPLLPVVWLANHLAGEGASLLAGEVVMTGSMVPTTFPPGPGPYRLEVVGLGTVDLTLVATVPPPVPRPTAARR